MRILQVQNRYQGGFGGEDRVMDNESRLLRTHGHDVHQFTTHNEEIGQGWSKLRAGLTHALFKGRRTARLPSHRHVPAGHRPCP